MGRSSNALGSVRDDECMIERRRQTFGPSLIRMEGISSLSIEVVFHQFGAPKREIFSSTLSCLTRSGIFALRKDIGVGITTTTCLPCIYERINVGQTL